ncbi:MAG: hypothetical protein R2882_07550 [Gemmatimonadales bacterium]
MLSSAGLGDVATVERKSADPTYLARRNGVSGAVFVTATQQAGWNIAAVRDGSG